MKIRFIKPFRFIGNAPDDGSDGTVPVGHIVDLENDESTQWLIDNGFAEKVEKAKESGWKPKLGDIYYVAYPDGLIASCTWDGCTVDLNRFLNGAVFKTKEATRRWRDYLKAIATVSQDNGFMKYDKVQGEVWELRRAYLDSEELFTARRIEYEGFHHLGAFYFDTEEHAIASSEKHPNEWETILNYDWSKE